jgi:hypothetical protein
MNTLAAAFTSSKITYFGLGIVATLISGIILSKAGRPLNSAIFSVHKLIALGTVILFAVGVRNLYRAAAVPAVQLIIAAISGLVFLALIVSGSLLSFDKLAMQPVLMIHEIAPWLALVFSTISLYLLAGSRS